MEEIGELVKSLSNSSLSHSEMEVMEEDGVNSLIDSNLTHSEVEVTAVNSESQVYDPVGEHMIALRQCHYDLSHLVYEAEERINKCQMSKKKSKHDTESFEKFSLPEFPENYPFKSSLPSAEFNEKGIRKKPDPVKLEKFPWKEVIKMIESSVEKILLQCGTFVDNSEGNCEVILCLSDLTQKYLKEFVGKMSQNRFCETFSDKDDLWGPLETTLVNIIYDGNPGFQTDCISSFEELSFGQHYKDVELGGVFGLHVFYRGIIKKHDRLYEECEKLLEKYETLVTE